MNIENGITVKKIFLLLILASFLACKSEANRKTTPLAVKGVIDLQNWDFERDGMIELVGDWEFYWNELIEDPKEQKEFFKNYDSLKLHYISVPSEWQNHQLD